MINANNLKKKNSVPLKKSKSVICSSAENTENTITMGSCSISCHLRPLLCWSFVIEHTWITNHVTRQSLVALSTAPVSENRSERRKDACFRVVKMIVSQLSLGWDWLQWTSCLLFSQLFHLWYNFVEKEVNAKYSLNMRKL